MNTIIGGEMHPIFDYSNSFLVGPLGTRESAAESTLEHLPFRVDTHFQNVLAS